MWSASTGAHGIRANSARMSAPPYTSPSSRREHIEESNSHSGQRTFAGHAPWLMPGRHPLVLNRPILTAQTLRGRRNLAAEAIALIRVHDHRQIGSLDFRSLLGLADGEGLLTGLL